MIKYLNPSYVFKISGKLLNLFKTLLIPLVAIGLIFSLFLSPEDYIQGDSVRIMYIHVPAAWIALSSYFLLGICAFFFLIWRHPLAEIAARSIAPIGAGFAMITLLTGSLWGEANLGCLVGLGW